jgi:hypothetical protein
MPVPCNVRTGPVSPRGKNSDVRSLLAVCRGINRDEGRSGDGAQARRTVDASRKWFFCRKPGLRKRAWLPALGFLRSGRGLTSRTATSQVAGERGRKPVLGSCSCTGVGALLRRHCLVHLLRRSSESPFWPSPQALIAFFVISWCRPAGRRRQYRPSSYSQIESKVAGSELSWVLVSVASRGHLECTSFQEPSQSDRGRRKQLR